MPYSGKFLILNLKMMKMPTGLDISQVELLTKDR